jgi:hypothetical protein
MYVFQIGKRTYTSNQRHKEQSSLGPEGQTVTVWDLCVISFHQRRFYFAVYFQQWQMVTRRKGKVCNQSLTALLFSRESRATWKGQSKEDTQRKNERHESCFYINGEFGIMARVNKEQSRWKLWFLMCKWHLKLVLWVPCRWGCERFTEDKSLSNLKLLNVV